MSVRTPFPSCPPHSLAPLPRKPGEAQHSQPFCLPLPLLSFTAPCLTAAWSLLRPPNPPTMPSRLMVCHQQNPRAKNDSLDIFFLFPEPPLKSREGLSGDVPVFFLSYLLVAWAWRLVGSRPCFSLRFPLSQASRALETLPGALHFPAPLSCRLPFLLPPPHLLEVLAPGFPPPPPCHYLQ